MIYEDEREPGFLEGCGDVIRAAYEEGGAFEGGMVLVAVAFLLIIMAPFLIVFWPIGMAGKKLLGIK